MLNNFLAIPTEAPVVGMFALAIFSFGPESAVTTADRHKSHGSRKVPNKAAVVFEWAEQWRSGGELPEAFPNSNSNSNLL